MERESADGDQPGTARTRADLRAELSRRNLPRHLALFYESTSAQLDAVAAYLEHGLATGRRCLYLLDRSSPGRIREALGTTTIDVERRTAAGDLVLRDASEVYLDSGFDPERMIQTLEDACEDSLAAGYDGLYVAGENSWCFHTEMAFDHVLDFEADFDATCPDLPVVALCQYDLARFGEESVAKALWTHEKIIYRNTICENPFYVPPDEYREVADAHLNVKLMLEQALSLTRSRQRVGRHEQRLGVVNRVLRHNIRNDLNVVRGNLRLVADANGAPDDAEDRLDAALRHVEKVLDVAEKARYVQGTLGSSRVGPVHLGSAVGTAVDEVTARHPDADVDVQGSRDVSVLADTNLDTAIREALASVLVYQERDPPSVALALSTPTPDLVRLDVRGPGSIPETARRAVEQGRETQLGHASGLGLWLARWIVENGQGSLQFPEGDDGTVELRIELSRIPASSSSTGGDGIRSRMG